MDNSTTETTSTLTVVSNIDNWRGVMNETQSRKDQEIKVDITNQIYWDSRVDASNVKVGVEEGNVTLTGTVKTYRARSAAWDDAAVIEGVKKIKNGLEVQAPETQSRIPDEELEESIMIRLNFDQDLHGDFSISAKSGVVTLNGTLPNFYQKLLAEDIASQTIGVKSVINNIAVVPTNKLSDELIGKDITKAFLRSRVDPETIDVMVEDGLVTLNGKVQWGKEWLIAMNIARNTFGVVDVRDEIDIRKD